MEIRPIRTDADHREAPAEIERLWACPDEGPENRELDVLATLVEAHESRRWPRRDCTPVEILRDALTDMGPTQAELAGLLGSRSTASELLRGKRRISLAAAQTIGAAWRMPIQPLVGPCGLAA